MDGHPGRVPGWNLGLRFLLELTAFAGLAWMGWRLGDGPPGWILAVLLPLAAMTVWGVFAVPGDPSRSGKAPRPVSGPIRLGLELFILGGGAVAYAVAGAVAIAAVAGGLIVLHLAFSTSRIRWLVRQR